MAWDRGLPPRRPAERTAAPVEADGSGLTGSRSLKTEESGGGIELQAEGKSVTDYCRCFVDPAPGGGFQAGGLLESVASVGSRPGNDDLAASRIHVEFRDRIDGHVADLQFPDVASSPKDLSIPKNPAVGVRGEDPGEEILAVRNIVAIKAVRAIAEFVEGSTFDGQRERF